MIRLLSSTNENTLISAMATLYYLMDYPQGLTGLLSFSRLTSSPFESFCPNCAHYLCHLREHQDREYGFLHLISSVPCFQQTHILSLSFTLFVSLFSIRQTSESVRRVHLHRIARRSVLWPHTIALLPLIAVPSFIHRVLLPVTHPTRSHLPNVAIRTRSVHVMAAASNAAARSFASPTTTAAAAIAALAPVNGTAISRERSVKISKGEGEKEEGTGCRARQRCSLAFDFHFYEGRCRKRPYHRNRQ